MKRITRSGPVDQTSGTTIYTVPVGETADIGGLRVTNSNINTQITVTHFDHGAGTSTTYSKDLIAGDQFSDDQTFSLASEDYLKIESTNAGVTYFVYIDTP